MSYLPAGSRSFTTTTQQRGDTGRCFSSRALRASRHPLVLVHLTIASRRGVSCCPNLASYRHHHLIRPRRRRGMKGDIGCCCSMSITLLVSFFIVFLWRVYLADLDIDPDIVTLPLWSPAPVAVGAVGYLDRPSGTFVTLFNSYDPTRTSKGRANLIPSLSGYGKVSQGRQRQDKRNAALRGYDMVQGMISRSKGDGSAACVSLN